MTTLPDGCDILAVLERLTVIQASLAEARVQQRETRRSIGAIEHTLAYIQRDVGELRTETNGRFDRVLDRLERIEHRLDMDAAP